MSRAGLNYHQVELLYQVIRCRTLTAAAKVLYISQPAITKQIKTLENSLGVKLFTREKGRMLPSAEALLLYEHMERTNTSLRALNEIADGLRLGSMGRLTICTIPAIAEYLLPAAMAAFEISHPSVSIEVTIENTDRMLDLVEAQQVDLAICAPFRNIINADEIPLLFSKMLCVMPATDSLAHYKSLQLNDLCDEPLTIVGAFEGIPELKQFLASNGRLIHSRVSSSLFACKLVELVKRRAIIDGLTASSFTPALELSFVRIEDIPERKISMFIPSSRIKSSFLVPFIKILKNVAAELAPTSEYLVQHE